jgi:ribosomal-protein-alanine N-acetyltransferase
MKVDDLDRVMEIEEVAHISPWSISGYRHELEENELAYYLVLLPAEEANLSPVSTFGKRLLTSLRTSHRGRPIIGYAGFWLIADEAHISTIAIDPQWQRLGLGEYLLLELIKKALQKRAEMITLEVRSSNQTAKNLYMKYDFKYVGKRKRYYKDSNEDAHIMTVFNVQGSNYHSFLDKRRQKLYQRFAED